MTADARAELAPQQTRAIATRSSFYLAMRILEPPRRDAMYAIHAFCRAVDDIADEDGDRAARLAQLDAWRYELDELYAGRIRPRCGFLAEPVRRFRLDRADFEAVIDGMAMDVEADIRAPDWTTLDLYCDRVASAVGRLSVRVFGLAEEANGADGGLPTGPKLLAYHMGRALQLTNILRDLDEDALRGRLYLPREALEEAGVTPAAPRIDSHHCEERSDEAIQGPLDDSGLLRSARNDEGVKFNALGMTDLTPPAVLAHQAIDKVCAAVATRARGHYEEADLLMAACPQGAVKAPYLMAAAYRSILDRLVARGFAPPRAPVHASRVKIILAFLRYAFS
jgi:phytoene synthase